MSIHIFVNSYRKEIAPRSPKSIIYNWFCEIIHQFISTYTVQMPIIQCHVHSHNTLSKPELVPCEWGAALINHFMRYFNAPSTRLSAACVLLWLAVSSSSLSFILPSKGFKSKDQSAQIDGWGRMDDRAPLWCAAIAAVSLLSTDLYGMADNDE